MIQFPFCAVDPKTALTEYEQRLGPKSTETPLSEYGDPKDVFNRYHRFGNNKTREDKRFPDYNAALIPNTQHILGEGPDHSLKRTYLDAVAAGKITEADYQTLYYPQLPEQRLRKMTIDNPQCRCNIFVAVGQTNNDAESDAKTDFADYFQHGQGIKASDFFIDLITKQNKQDLLTDPSLLEMLALADKSTFGFYRFNKTTITADEIEPSEPSNGYTVYIPTWPDHGVLQFPEADQMVMLLLALLNPLNFTHCRAGRGRSVTTIVCREALIRGIGLLNDADELVRHVVKFIREIRPIKSGAMYLGEQFVLCFELLAGMTRQYQHYQEMCDRLHGQPITAPNTMRPMVGVMNGGAAEANTSQAQIDEQAGSLPHPTNNTPPASPNKHPAGSPASAYANKTLSRVKKTPEKNKRLTSVFRIFALPKTLTREQIEEAKRGVKYQWGLPERFAGKCPDDETYLDAIDYMKSLVEPLLLVLKDIEQTTQDTFEQFSKEYQFAVLTMGDICHYLGEYQTRMADQNRTGPRAKAKYESIKAVLLVLSNHPLYAQHAIQQGVRDNIELWKDEADRRIGQLNDYGRSALAGYL